MHQHNDPSDPEPAQGEPLALLDLGGLRAALLELHERQGIEAGSGRREPPRAPLPGEEVEDHWQFFLDWHTRREREALERHNAWRESTRNKDALGLPDKLTQAAREEASLWEYVCESAGARGVELPAELEAAETARRASATAAVLSPSGKGTNCDGGFSVGAGRAVELGALRTFLAPDPSRSGWGVAGDGGMGGYPEGQFLGRVERLTQPHRVGVASAHVRSAVAYAKASEVARLESMAGDTGEVVSRVRGGQRVEVPAAEAYETSSDWHLSRAEGQRRRFETLRHCGEGAVHVRCQGRSKAGGSCVWESSVPLGCGVPRICVGCRQRRATPERKRFALARDVTLRELKKSGKLRVKRHGGAYTEKHLTLTIPDGHIVGDGAVGWRVNVIFEAWRAFSGRLRRWLKTAKFDQINFYRGFEWTPGADGLGHPHFHVWLLSPYLPVHLLHWWWALSLREQGVLVFGEDDQLYFTAKGNPKRSVRPTGPLRGEKGEEARARRGSYVNLDVRRVHVRRSDIRFEVIKGGKSLSMESPRLRVEAHGGGNDLIGYIAGWMVADRDENGRLVPPSVNAELYAALEGRKQVRASDGFLAKGERPCACPECSTEGRFLVALVPWNDPDLDAKREAIGLHPIRSPARASPGLLRPLAKTNPRQQVFAVVS